jgi:hypothetical protein
MPLLIGGFRLEGRILVVASGIGPAIGCGCWASAESASRYAATPVSWHTPVTTPNLIQALDAYPCHEALLE